MLAFLEAVEEERCRQLEEKSKKKVKRRKINKPWQRGALPGLCQDPDLLLMVSDYAYDLEDPGFQRYCRERGVLHVAGVPGSERWMLFRDFGTGEDEFLQNRSLWISQVGKEFTAEQMDTHWEIIRLGRSKLQDCWELYVSRGDE
jgi:hypothetical protein